MATNKERLEANNEKIKAIQETLNGKILSVNKEYIDLAKQMVDGTLEEFDNKKIGATSIMSYVLYQYQTLKKADFTGVKDIMLNVCKNCTSLTELVLDENITSVGDNSFAGCSAINNGLDFKTPCTIGQYAFDGAGITGLTGKFLDIGAYAFQNCNKLTNFDVTINGSFNIYTFAYLYYINNFNLSKESNITSINSGCFRGVGGKRENPENNILELDFLNSTFTSVPQYCLAGYSSSTMNSYMNIYLPNTIKSLGNYALGYSDHINIYFTSTTPPTLTTSSFSNNTNYKIFVPYEVVNAYKTATNWTTKADYIYGFADKNYFEQGQMLPEYSFSGYALTWYSDKDLTNQVTMVDNPSQYYYCVVGTEQVEVVSIGDIYSENANITISNSATGYVYNNKGAIQVGTQLTIMVTPSTDEYTPYIQMINGEEFVSPYSYTTLIDTNINIYSVWYAGDVTPNSDFAQNSWAVIKKTIQSGNASQYWSVGAVKEIEINGLTYGVRLSDLQAGRYNYASGTKTTNAVFEFVELYATDYRIHSKTSNLGGWATCEMRTVHIAKILNKLPLELRYLLDDVLIKSADGGSYNYTGITESDNKLFFPCAEEVGLSVSSYGRTGEGTVWDYYVDAVNATRLKHKHNTGNRAWWLRSPWPKGADGFTAIGNDGDGYQGSAWNTNGVCPCFAW